MNPTIHLCLVSDRPLANLIPLLQYRPDYVALGVSPKMQQQGQDFRKLLIGLGEYTDEHILSFAISEQGIEQIRENALHIESELQSRFPGCRIAYNATGGTKLMALAFAEFLSNGDNQVFYTDTAQGCIEFIYPKPASETMQSVLDIKNYLCAYGKRLGRTASDDPDWVERALSRKKLSVWLARNAEALESLFGTLNAMAQNALAQKLPRGQPPRIALPLQCFHTTPWRGWLEALEKINAAGCCQWDEAKPENIYFHDANGAKYLSGGWLEEYVWNMLAEAAPEDFKAGAEFTDMARPRDDVRNELDGIAAHRNRLLLIECKTGRLDEGAEVVYKLDSIAHDMGLFQQRLLVSARPLDEATRARAKAEDIAIVEGVGLKQLRDTLKNWMENRR